MNDEEKYSKDGVSVNEYVRTRDGDIFKVADFYEKGNIYTMVDERGVLVGNPRKVVKKHSFNIIDLIEEDDIGIMRYKGLIFKKFITKDDILELKFKNYKLLEIVTREQFKSMKYEVEKMTNADTMFEELGYKLIPRTTSRSYSLKYYKDDDNVIYFDEEDREIRKDGEYAETCYGITIPELKAISRKCKELRVVR